LTNSSHTVHSEEILEREALARSVHALMGHTYTANDLVTRAPISCTPETDARQAALTMRNAHVSSLGVIDEGSGNLVGLITIRDLVSRVLAEGRSPDTPVRDIMTADPITLPSSALGVDILNFMLRNKVGHLPISNAGKFDGMITQTDLIRVNATSATALVHEISDAQSVPAMVTAASSLPDLLVRLVAGHQSHEVVTRLITDIADAITRRLLTLAEHELGPAPVPYLWLACGSQGRQEQTGLSDQDNCLILDNAVDPTHMAYFKRLAEIVSQGLDACGYEYCPGDMMATNSRWRQPERVWRKYFRAWVATPSPESQMLASVMFDLRPIGGAVHLHKTLRAETLAAASTNSIFVAHMIANSQKRTPALGFIRQFSTLRSGPYRHQIDMKHNGVIPVTDLARIYALQARLPEVNTRARLLAAEHAGIISASGAHDLIEAYDVISRLRLERQARLIRSGAQPANYLDPAELSNFQRKHLRNAFMVVRSMQAALGQDKSALT
jgi:CBS domain-containing protein